MLEIGTEDMVAVLDAVDDGGEFAMHPAVHTGAEDCADLVAGEPPQTELAAAFEQFVDGKVPLEDEVAAIFDLSDRVEARKVEPGALLGGELRAQDQRPVVEPLLGFCISRLLPQLCQRGDQLTPSAVVL